jgi:predicted permease
MINLQLTLFILMGAGFAAAKLKLIGSATRKQLSDILIYIILPCNIVVSFLIKYNRDILMRCAAVLIIGFAAQALYYLLSRVLYNAIAPRQRAVLQYGTLISNSGFLGLPVANYIFGAEGLLYASIALIPMRFFMWSAGLALFTETSGKKTIKILATHPCIIAVFVGFALMLSGIPLPPFLNNSLRALSNCTSAVSMMVIGAILADIPLRSGIMDRNLIYFSCVRLALIPGLVLLALKLCHIVGLTLGVTVLLASMPAASTTAILAEKYNADSELASRCVFVSTLLSMLTMPVWGYILNRVM